MSPKRILILMSDTGGGHRASAQAIVDALGELFPSRFECSVVDIWTDHAAWPLNKFVPWYQFLARNPFLWRTLWCSNRPLPTAIEISNAACFSRFRGCIEAYAPDLVVSVHPLCQHLPLRVLRHLAEEKAGDEPASTIPFATVVTDLGGAHPMWFHRDVDLCCVPSDTVRQLADRAGLDTHAHQVRQHGLPLRVGFSKPEPRSRDELRRVLSIEAGTPTVLVVGGGDGVGGIETVARALVTQLTAGAKETRAEDVARRQMVVVCGKNVEARTALEELAASWEPHEKVRKLAFRFSRSRHGARRESL